MLDLASRVKSALENPNAAPWLPELTSELAEIGWDTLRGVGITINDYSTSRVLSGKACIPQNIIAHLPTFSGVEGAKSTICVESLPPDLACHYHKDGITFYTPDEIKDTKVLSCLEDAASILNRVPTLMPTVATLVRALHLIKPEDDDYDVSFSEPHIPFSAFMSVPRRHTTTNTIRVAEALVHEAMHLQLTLVEFIVPLVNSASEKYLSPWRGEYRNAQGILHALYVFRVIERFFHHLLSLPISLGEITSYCCERRSQITAQICEIQSFQYCPGLTEAGAKFVQQLINTSENECQPII